MYEIFGNHIGKLCLDWRNKGSLENFSPSSNSQLVTDVYTSFSFKIQAQWRLPEVELGYLVANLRVPIYWSILSHLLRGTHIHFVLAVVARVSCAKLSSANARLDASRTWFSATFADRHGVTSRVDELVFALAENSTVRVTSM